MRSVAPDGSHGPCRPSSSSFCSSDEQKAVSTMAVERALWRKPWRTHLEIVSSHELFARRLSSSVDTLHRVSTGRCCSCGALQQLQLQPTALGVLQHQHADTPKFISASSGGLQRALSENGNESRRSRRRTGSLHRVRLVRRCTTPTEHSAWLRPWLGHTHGSTAL